jgi:hypothetical protein
MALGIMGMPAFFWRVEAFCDKGGRLRVDVRYSLLLDMFNSLFKFHLSDSSSWLLLTCSDLCTMYSCSRELLIKVRRVFNEILGGL